MNLSFVGPEGGCQKVEYLLACQATAEAVQARGQNESMICRAACWASASLLAMPEAFSTIC